MTYNEKDGIRYITLATTGGKLERTDPLTGQIHEIHHVSVRKNAEPAITVLPVKSTLDITKIQPKQQNELPAIQPKPKETDTKKQEMKPVPGTVL
jgi:hypothetical protein